MIAVINKYIISESFSRWVFLTFWDLAFQESLLSLRNPPSPQTSVQHQGTVQGGHHHARAAESEDRGIRREEQAESLVRKVGFGRWVSGKVERHGMESQKPQLFKEPGKLREEEARPKCGNLRDQPYTYLEAEEQMRWDKDQAVV